MRSPWLKFIVAVAVTTVLMMCFRCLALTVYTVSGEALEPSFIDGDRVLVNRWSYGLRGGDGRLFRYMRWMPRQVERGDLVAFNCPADSTRRVSSRPVYFCYCKAVPGDTVRAQGMELTVPGRSHNVRVTKSNMRLIAYLYNRYEGRKAVVKGGRLTVDGAQVRCADFVNDYYWLYSGQPDNANDSRYFGFVPESHVIGRVSMLLYSIAPGKSVLERLRPGRSLLFINSQPAGKPD